MLARLAQLLTVIDAIDPSYGSGDPATYPHRNRLVFAALGVALAAGMPGGVAFEGDLGWMLVYIELPTGQVSWHVPVYPGVWDGHDRTVKRERIDAFRRAYLDAAGVSRTDTR